jgi:MFS family permease
VIDQPSPLRPMPPGPAAARLPWWNPRAWGQTFAALDNRAYARYFWGTFAFFFAMQMQMLLRGYLIYDLTGDAFALGLISVTFAAPMLVLAPVAGVVADRLDRRTIIVVSQSIGLALTALTTLLILTGTIAFWHLLVISLFSASTMVFNMPARQAMVPALVGPEKLMNAIALTSGSMNVCRIVAPATAGLLVAPIGVGGGYLVTLGFNVLAVLLFLRVPSPGRAEKRQRSFFGDMWDGVAFMKDNRLVLLLLIVGMVPMLLAMPHQNLLPVFAADVWDVGAVGLGLLQTLAGIGGLAGAAVAANLSGVRRPGRLLMASMVLFGVFIALFALSPTFVPALLIILVAEVFAMVGMTLNNTLIQSIIPDAVRGRVMSLMMMTFGITPLGTLPAGWVAREYGVRVAVAGGGLLLVVFSVAIFMLSRTYRQLDRSPSRDDETALRPMKPAAGISAIGD